MTTMYLTHDLQKRIRDAIQLEPNEPQDTIMRVLQEHDGKRLDKRVIEKINSALETQGWFDVIVKKQPAASDVRIRKIAGMTQLEWGAGDDHGSLLIAYALINVTIDAAWIKEKNIGYFGAKDERNSIRQQITEEEIARLANIAIRWQEANDELNDMLDDFDGKFYHDKYKLEELIRGKSD